MGGCHMEQTEQFEGEAYAELSRFAQTIGMTTEEYLVGLHEKNQSVKNMLLRDGQGFKQFVEDFHDLLDDITHYKEALLAEAKSEKDEVLLKAVVGLLYKSSSDPMLLAQMYEHYHYEDDEKNHTL